MTEFPFTSAVELARGIRAREYSPVEVVDAHLDRIAARNDVTNAYVTVVEEEAREAAREAERALESGDELGPLHGVPIAVKDLTLTEGVRTTFCSAPFEDFVPEENAAIVDRFEEAGAINLGKTNSPEFGFKGTTDNPLFGATGTPFDPSRTAGGSSGGAAAAVADGLAPIAQGSDAGGSVRIPAACCGVYGFKPSFRRAPMDGRPDGFAYHTPFTDYGPLARTVEDAALLMDVMAGPHPRDPFVLPDDGTDHLAATTRGIEGLSVGYAPDLGGFPVSGAVREVVDEAAHAFEDAGATVEEIDPGFPDDPGTMEDAWKTGFRVQLAAMAANLREDSGVDLLGEHRERVTPELVDQIEAGRQISGVEFKRADVVRTRMFDALQDRFEEYDLVVAPTNAVPPFDLDVLGPEEIEGVEVDPLYGWFLTWPINLTGHPAASIPAGFADGLPVGMQVVGRRYADETVIAASAAYERVRPWDDAYPPG